jgi:hypothetical protein
MPDQDERARAIRSPSDNAMTATANLNSINIQIQ